MKKILGVSFAAILAVSPMLAMAEGEVYTTNGSPVTAATGAANNITTTAAAPYASVDAKATNDIASTSYVKGAYNAAIQAVNKVAADVKTLDTNMDDYVEKSAAVAEAEDEKTIHYATETSSTENFVGKNIGHLDAQVYTNTTDISTLNSAANVSGSVANTVKTTAANADYDAATSGLNANTLAGAIDALDTIVDGINTDMNSVATKEGVVATVEKATVSGTVSGTATGTVNVYTTWNTTDTQPANISAGFSNVALENGTVSLASDKYYEDMSDTTGTSYTPSNPDA